MPDTPKAPAQAVASRATAELAARIREITFATLDQQTVDTVKRLISDGIAVAAAGTREAPPAIVADYVRELGCAPQASAWGFGFKTSAAQAAFVNGVSMHVLDFEPMSNPPAHAVSPTLPAALALAEWRGATGADIITACAKGFEIQGRILMAANPERGAIVFHAPGVVGLMGAATTASHLLDLDAAQTAHALGIAASRCSGLHANIGSMVKCTHCGNAAAAGVEAALLAKRGFTAHPAILGAHGGYVETFFPAHFDYAALLDFGRPYRCVDPGMAIKFFPSKYPTQFAIAAALPLNKVIADKRKISSVRIVTPNIEDADRPQPRSGLEGKFSFQYTAAVGLLDGDVGLASFTDERRFKPDIVDLLGKTTVVRNAEFSRDTRKMRVEIEVTLEDGTRHTQVCTKPPGFWGEPVDRKLHGGKLRDCLSVRFQTLQVEEIMNRLDRFENLSATETAEFLALLA